MLRWLQKKLPKVATLWAKLCAIAVGAHVTLLFLLFFVYKGNFSDLKLEINANCDKNALVVFMPFQKTVHNKSTGRSGKQSEKSNKASKAKVRKQEKTEAPKVSKIIEKGPTSLAAQKPIKPIIKKPKKTKAAKKEVIKVDKKKEIIKPKEPKKVEEVKPKPKKIDEIKPIIPEPIKQDVPVKEDPIIDDVLATSTDVQEIDINAQDQNIRYIGQAELDAMCLQEKLSSAIAQHWSPPVGVAKNRVCELLIVVDWQGKVKDINVQKASGSAMYDVSTRTAALAAEYDKQFWGKSFCVTFKPSLR